MKFPIPSDWDGESWCRWSVCWPDSPLWEGFLRGLLTLPQRGWTWDERSGSILDVQEIGKEITALNLPLNGVFMACNDTELVNAFNDIALAIRYLADRQCCDTQQIDIHGGFQGTITQTSGETIPVYGSEPPIGLGEGEFPTDEYTTFEAYDADKCRTANNIIDALIVALNHMSVFENYKASTLAALIIVAIPSAIIFPPSMIPIAISVLVILVLESYVMAQLADAIQADRTHWVCMLYEGENTEGIIETIADALDVLIALIPVGGAVAKALKILALVFLNTNTVNRLFSGTEHAMGPDVDCNNCDPCSLNWNTIEGVFTGDGDLSFGGPKTLTSVLNPNGRHYIEFGFPIECCPLDVTVTIHSTTERVNDNAGGIVDCDLTTLWSYGEGPLPVGVPICARLFALGGCDIAWSCSVTIENTCA